VELVVGVKPRKACAYHDDISRGRHLAFGSGSALEVLTRMTPYLHAIYPSYDGYQSYTGFRLRPNFLHRTKRIANSSNEYICLCTRGNGLAFGFSTAKYFGEEL
jgi:hypothetical protein